MKIAIDKGHNRGEDQGAVAIGNENIMNIATGDKVIALLKPLGYEVLDIIANIGNDVSVNGSLNKRVFLANEWRADLYVSIHANATPGGTGVEVWIGSKSTRVMANTICSKISNAFGYKNRGSKLQGVDGGHLAVLNNTTMPALLVEQCFVDSQEDMSKWNPDIMAKCIVEGITGKSLVTTTATVVQPTQPIETPKYDESIPLGVFQIPGTTGYVEQATDGRLIIHKDRGNYICIGKGLIDLYWNDNNGHGGSKRVSG